MTLPSPAGYYAVNCPACGRPALARDLPGLAAPEPQPCATCFSWLTALVQGNQELARRIVTPIVEAFR
jgi:hypothetical protein